MDKVDKIIVVNMEKVSKYKSLYRVDKMNYE